MTEPRVRPVEPADHERLRELTFESKSHWGYDRDLVHGWAGGLGFESEQERWVVEVDGAIVAWDALIPPEDRVAVRLEWGAEPNAVGFYEKLGGRKLRDHVTEWGRVAPWMGLEL